MQESLENPSSIAVLDDLGVLRVQGIDAVKFLQGQLSNDVAQLSAGNPSMLAGYHNPQGRAIALLRLLWIGEDAILAVLPVELVAGVVARLSRFVLRAKVKLIDDTGRWQVLGTVAPLPADLGTPAIALGGTPPRWLHIAPAGPAPALPGFASSSRESWRALDIAAGLPQVYAATSEAFVAQMLNLDVLEGIAFDKGCYTGQEVIARAHYRGRVKRRMQRFRSETGVLLKAGDSGRSTDGRSFKVVEAVALGDGRCEFLAVAAVAGHADDAAVSGGSHDSSSEQAQALEVSAEQIPLPYTLPA